MFTHTENVSKYGKQDKICDIVKNGIGSYYVATNISLSICMSILTYNLRWYIKDDATKNWMNSKGFRQNDVNKEKNAQA